MILIILIICFAILITCMMYGLCAAQPYDPLDDKDQAAYIQQWRENQR